MTQGRLEQADVPLNPNGVINTFGSGKRKSKQSSGHCHNPQPKATCTTTCDQETALSRDLLTESGPQVSYLTLYQHAPMGGGGGQFSCQNHQESKVLGSFGIPAV